MNFRKCKRYLILFSIIFFRGGYSRGRYLKKIKYFKSIGEHVYLQPWNYGTEPELISFGDNIHIASNVHFTTHDITSFMFNYMDKNNHYRLRQGEIKIGNNVFIGAGTRILYDVTIDDNVIIGAGSLVNKSIPSGTVAAGVPCKVIGSFEDYMNKMREYEREE